MAQSTGLMATAEETYNRINPPALPASIKELLVTFAPWLSLLGGVLGLLVFVPGVLFLLVLSPVAGVAGAGLDYVGTIMHLILSAVGAVMSLMAFPGLKRRSFSGWTMAFWASTVYVVAGLFPLGIGSLIGTAIGAAIGLYVLFQTKPYYDGTIAPRRARARRRASGAPTRSARRCGGVAVWRTYMLGDWEFFLEARDERLMLWIPDCGGQMDMLPKVPAQLAWVESRVAAELPAGRQEWDVTWVFPSDALADVEAFFRRHGATPCPDPAPPPLDSAASA
jgi:hypothetical protein